MDSPATITQTFIHSDMKFVPNNFMAPLLKTPSSDGFYIVQDFLVSSPLGFALTHPTKVSAKAIQQIWNHSSIADNGDIFFTHAANTFVITKDIIVKALRLPESQSAAASYLKNEMRVFLTRIGYTGDIRRMGRLVRTKLRKEWNFYFDCLGRCFTNKCSNFDALNHLVQHIGYSLLHNANFDIASIILEYLGLRISEGKNVYFARFVDLFFKYLYDILDFRVSINKCYVFSCYYICVIVSVLVYISFGRIFNVAITRIISTSRIDDRTFDQENSDKPDSGSLFLNIFKETVNYRIFSKL